MFRHRDFQIHVKLGPIFFSKGKCFYNFSKKVKTSAEFYFNRKILGKIVKTYTFCRKKKNRTRFIFDTFIAFQNFAISKQNSNSITKRQNSLVSNVKK